MLVSNRFASAQGEGLTMNKENWFRVVALMALIGGAGLQGCASIGMPVPPAAPSQVASPTSESVAVSKSMVTIENLLRWPLEGREGADKVIAGLRQVYEIVELRPLLFAGDGPVQLEDGYTLGSTLIGPGQRDFDINVKEESCFLAARAAAVIGAVPSPVIQDAHGVDRGKIYDARRNGMWIRFTTTPGTSRCIKAIYVRSSKEANP